MDTALGPGLSRTFRHLLGLVSLSQRPSQKRPFGGKKHVVFSWEIMENHGNHGINGGFNGEIHGKSSINGGFNRKIMVLMGCNRVSWD